MSGLPRQNWAATQEEAAPLSITYWAAEAMNRELPAVLRKGTVSLAFRFLTEARNHEWTRIYTNGSLWARKTMATMCLVIGDHPR